MERRCFLYITGVSGIGLIAGAGGELLSSSDDMRELEALLCQSNDDEISCVHLMAKRAVIPTGRSLSLSRGVVVRSPSAGDLTYTLHPDGSTSFDVVGRYAALAGPYTKSSNHFGRQIENGAFMVPARDVALRTSETLVYRSADARRLGRPSATDTFLYVRRTNNSWSALHIASANQDRVIVDFVERV
jgi:hypothetical protein